MTSVIVAEVFAQLGKTRKGRTTPVLGETSAWGTAFQSIGSDFSFGDLNNNVRAASRSLHINSESGGKTEKLYQGGNRIVGLTKTVTKRTSKVDSDGAIIHHSEVKENLNGYTSKHSFLFMM